MLTYTLEKKGKISLYEALYAHIRDDILSGRLGTGERLPSKRMLSQHMKISIITVENAYAQLIAEGYVYTVQKKGYYVAGITKAPVGGFKKPVTAIENAVPVQYFIDFKKNSVSTEMFPFTVWAKTMRRVVAEQDKKLLEPLSFNGVPELRNAIAKYLYESRGMSVDANQIIIGSGTEYLYNLSLQLLGRDKVYAVENPGYTKISKIYNLNGISCVHTEIDGEGLSVDSLSKTDADVVHISPAHHFPTGIVMPVGRRQSLLAWAREKEGRYILEDDYDSEFRYSGKPIPTMLSTDTDEKVIYINTFSKTIAPSIRISYMILPPHLLRKYKEQMNFYTCTVASLDQYVLAEFISDGSFEKHLSRTKKLYRQKRDSVISAIKESPVSDRVTVNEEQAGLHFLLKIDTSVTDAQLKIRAEEKGIRLALMSDYLYKPDNRYDRILVLNYSGIETERLPEALSRLSEIID